MHSRIGQHIAAIFQTFDKATPIKKRLSAGKCKRFSVSVH